MKKSFVAIVLAGFLGGFGALEADHYLTQHSFAIPFIGQHQNSDLFNVAYTGPNLSPAPFDFRAAAKKISPSVVSVDRYDDVPVGFFGDEVVRQQSGTGSGVIISNSGIIVTNNHVVAGAKRVRVRLADEHTSYDAKVLGTDPRSDLAVIQIPSKNVSPIEIGTSKDIEVGQWVVAVGNPLGFDNTVSVGVVSSLKRNLPVGDMGMVDAIQTDAAINPGNSGGALCNSQGQLIGINSAIASGTGQSVGIGFAIPVDRVKAVVNDIVKFGYAKYAGLGITYQPRFEGALGDQNFRDQVAEQVKAQNVPSHGILVMESTGDALQAGIHKFDVILAVDDTEIDGSFDLNKALVPKKPGDTVRVKYWSKGKELTKSIVLQEVHQPVQP